MVKNIFVNLPVKDLEKSKAFFSSLGFSFDPRFTDENAACLVLGENIYAMLLTGPFFRTFTRKDLCDAARCTEVLIAIDAQSRAEVDALVRKALAAGGTLYVDKPQDYGWMYGHGFADLDGHQWEVLYMDESAIPEKTSSEA